MEGSWRSRLGLGLGLGNRERVDTVDRWERYVEMYLCMFQIEG